MCASVDADASLEARAAGQENSNALAKATGGAHATGAMDESASAPRAVSTRRSRAAREPTLLNARSQSRIRVARPAPPRALARRTNGARSQRTSSRVGLAIGRHAPTRSKGNRVNIPEPGGGDRALGPQCGNATELGDASVDPGKSSLFFVRSGLPGIGLSSDRDVASVKRRASRGVRCIGAGP